MSMWGGKKREEEPLRPATSAPSAADLGREGIPMQTYPTRREEPQVRTNATIGKSLLVKGSITGREDVQVDGRLEGDVELPEHRLTVGVGGHVQGGVRAREIVVLGSVHGNLEAVERIEIKRNAKVVGDLRAARFVVEDEAYFKGNIETIRTDAPKPAGKPAAAATAAAPAAVEAQGSLLPGEPRR